MQCPTCHGFCELDALVNRGLDISTHSAEKIKCITCNGNGEVDDEFPRRLNDGKAFSTARREREESLYACAQRLGVSSAQLSSFENGRLLPDEILVKIIGTH